MTRDLFRQRLEKEYDRIKSTEKKLRQTVAKELGKSEFSCLRCGKCCRREDGDNTVFVRPGEIERITEKTGLSFEETAAPLFPDVYERQGGKYAVTAARAAAVLEEIADQIAPDGRVRTFGWTLRRKPDGSCRFLNADNKCLVYEERPLLCRTYPFYLEDGTLTECECGGIGNGTLSKDGCRLLADDLTDRYLLETDDMIMTYDTVRDHLPDDGGSAEGLKRAQENAAAGFIRFIVYDSRGVTEVTETLPIEHNED